MDKYEAPVFEIIALDAEDVIITSCGGGTQGDMPGAGLDCQTGYSC
jgi:hypothetical protein